MSRPESDMGHDWETRVRNTAQQFVYPPTPDVSRRVLEALAVGPTHLNDQTVRARRLAWVTLALLILLGALLLVPDVRARIREILHIGRVQISLEGSQPEVAATLPPLVLPDKPGRELVGETTLEAAQVAAGFPIRYPPALGKPDHVFVQHMSGPLVILVWVIPEDPSRAKVSLHLLGRGVDAFKGMPERIEETTVNGQQAIWTTGPYMLIYSPGRGDIGYLVEGHVLVWEADELTYRLETDLTMDEAIQLAETMGE